MFRCWAAEDEENNVHVDGFSPYALRWERSDEKFRLRLDSEQRPAHGYYGRSSSCYSMSASRLHGLPAAAVQQRISPKETLLRKDAWVYYYKKDVYSNLKYAQIIHRGSDHSFSLPPR